MALDEKKWEEIKSQHGEEYVLRFGTPLGDVVLRAPTEPEYKIFRKAVLDEKTKSHAYSNICLSCLLYPTREEFSAAFAKKPGLVDIIGIKVAALAGQEEDLVAKK